MTSDLMTSPALVAIACRVDGGTLRAGILFRNPHYPLGDEVDLYPSDGRPPVRVRVPPMEDSPVYRAVLEIVDHGHPV